jgi:hypothetical protein
MNALIKKVEAAMVAKGWTLAMNVMSDSGLNYGALYFKDDMDVYLNKDTVESLATVFKVN